MRKLQLTSFALEGLKYWKEADEKIYDKIKRIIEQIRISPKIGIGKPEPLKYE
jgi:toxin YoeB